jgi:Acyl-CoA reductase (LuxC)
VSDDAAAIRAAGQRLREAGRALRLRDARETLAAVGRVLERWRDAGSPWRRRLESELPAATGFSAGTVREGLEQALRGWTAEALADVVSRELGPLQRLDAAGPSLASGFELTAVVLAGSIPMPSLLSMLLPLVVGSPVLAKCASRDPVTPPLVASSVAEADAELGRCVEVVRFASDDALATRQLLAAECVVATGSDETLAAVASQVTPPRRLVAHGHRLSLAVVGAEAVREPALGDLAERLALDVALWDQLGCLSPVAVYAVAAEREPAERLAGALAAALAAAQGRWPRGRIEPAASAAIRRERGAAELRAAGGRPVFVHASEGTGWTVVREDSAEWRPAPLHRFVRVHPVASREALLAALAPLGPHLAAVALEGFGAATAALAAALARLGASRICRPGSLQAPPLAWRRDGQPLLLPLVRLSDLDPGL